MYRGGARGGATASFCGTAQVEGERHIVSISKPLLHCWPCFLFLTAFILFVLFFFPDLPGKYIIGFIFVPSLWLSLYICLCLSIWISFSPRAFFLFSFLVKVSELQAVNAELQKRLSLAERDTMGNAQREPQGQLDLIGFSPSSEVIRSRISLLNPTFWLFVNKFCAFFFFL